MTNPTTARRGRPTALNPNMELHRLAVELFGPGLEHKEYQERLAGALQLTPRGVRGIWEGQRQVEPDGSLSRGPVRVALELTLRLKRIAQAHGPA